MTAFLNPRNNAKQNVILHPAEQNRETKIGRPEKGDASLEGGVKHHLVKRDLKYYWAFRKLHLEVRGDAAELMVDIFFCWITHHSPIISKQTKALLMYYLCKTEEIEKWDAHRSLDRLPLCNFVPTAE